MLNPEPPSSEAHTHAGHNMAKDGEDMEGLFAEEDEESDSKESMEDLFEDDDSEK
jgi:hypothetical protein